MSEIYKHKDSDLLTHWALECLKSKKLTYWERQFCTSIYGTLITFGELTQRQEEVLESIYTEKTN